MARIHVVCFRNPRPWSAAEFSAFLDADHCFVVSAPDGFALGRVIAGEAELLTLAVRPGARRQGIGARLLAGFLQTAQARGAVEAFLEVSAANESARALYRTAGFDQVGLRAGYYRAAGECADALVLRRPLGLGGG